MSHVEGEEGSGYDVQDRPANNNQYFGVDAGTRHKVTT